MRRTDKPGGPDTIKKGLLLESDGSTGIALTHDGRFVRVLCRPGDEEGREVVIDRRRAQQRARAAFRALSPRLAVAAVLLLCLLVTSPFAVGRVLASGDPVAYVTVDINPSIEFGVNRWDRVVTARAFDADGEAVLSGLDWKGRILDDVLSEVAAAAVDLGYLQPGGDDGAFLVAAVPVGDDRGWPARTVRSRWRPSSPMRPP